MGKNEMAELEERETTDHTKNEIRLLIIDDNEEFANTCVEYFEKKHIDVDVANNGITGIKKFKENSSDIVILDYKMPGFSGYEVMQKIKRLNSRVKIIFLTAYENELVLSPSEQKIFCHIQTMRA